MNQIPLSKCLACGVNLDAATFTGPEDKRPTPGAITICFYCGHIMAFAYDLTLRALTDEEMIEVAGHPTLLEWCRVVQKARERRSDIDKQRDTGCQ
jgi:hypothetical protein